MRSEEVLSPLLRQTYVRPTEAAEILRFPLGGSASESLEPFLGFREFVGEVTGHGIAVRAVVPGNCELDPKALARATGDKKADTVPLKEVEPLTGYIRGGVTALACKKPYPVYLDETAQLFDVISVSAGMRGLQGLIAPDDYLRAVNAEVAPFAKGKGLPEH